MLIPQFWTALFHPQDHELSGGITEENSIDSAIQETGLHSNIGPSCFKLINNEHHNFGVLSLISYYKLHYEASLWEVYEILSKTIFLFVYIPSLKLKSHI